MPGRDHSRNPLSLLHDRLAIGLVLFVILSAVPVASNRAPLWLVWTALLAATTLYVFLRSWRIDPRWTPRVTAHRALFALGLAVPLWSLVQLLPLPQGWPGLPAGPSLSVLPQAGPSAILRLAGYVLLAILLVEVTSRADRILRMVQILFLGIVLQALFALAALKLMGDIALWGPKTAYLGAATGTFVNRNALATHLGFGLILGTALLAQRAGRTPIRTSNRRHRLARIDADRLFILTGMAFLLIALTATQSRLGLVASLLGLTTALLIARLDAGVARAQVLGEAMLLLALTMAMLLMLGAGGLSDRLLLAGADSGNRLAIYAQTMDLIAQRPLTGHGLDAFGAAFEAVRAPPLVAPVTYDLAHNTYLALWTESGLLIGSAPIVAIFLVALRLIGNLRSRQGSPGMAAAGLGAICLAALHSAGDFSLEMPANAYLFITILALAMGRQRPRQGAHRDGGGTR